MEDALAGDDGGFRKVVDGKAEMVVVVHADDILAHAKYQATMDRIATELG